MKKDNADGFVNPENLHISGFKALLQILKKIGRKKISRQLHGGHFDYFKIIFQLIALKRNFTLVKINMTAVALFSVAHENGQCQWTRIPRKPIYIRFQGTIVNSKEQIANWRLF